MALMVDEIERSALALSAAQRVRLADKLLESLGEGETQPLPSEWIEEIDRRRKEFAEGRAELVPGELVSQRAWELTGKSRA